MASGVTIRWFQRPDQISSNLKGALAAGLNAHVKGVAKEVAKQTPKDTGALVDSMVIEKASAARTVATIGMGDKDTPYAAEVHNAKVAHATGKWRFLADPANNSASQMASTLARVIRATFGL